MWIFQSIMTHNPVRAEAAGWTEAEGSCLKLFVGRQSNSNACIQSSEVPHQGPKCSNPAAYGRHLIQTVKPPPGPHISHGHIIMQNAFRPASEVPEDSVSALFSSEIQDSLLTGTPCKIKKKKKQIIYFQQHRIYIAIPKSKKWDSEEMLGQSKTDTQQGKLQIPALHPLPSGNGFSGLYAGMLPLTAWLQQLSETLGSNSMTSLLTMWPVSASCLG